MPQPSPHAARSIDFGARTDAGRVRRNNEDRLLARPPLFAVADGMGGHLAGEVAAQMAVDLVGKALDGRGQLALQDLADVVVAANRAIHDTARDRPDLAGMG